MPRDVTGGYVRNIFTLRRLENGLGRDVIGPFLAELFEDIAAQIARLDPTEVKRRSFRVRRLERLLGSIRQLIGPTFDAVRKELRQQFAAIGVQQARWAESQLKRATEGVDVAIGSRVGVNLFKRLIDTDPIDGRMLTEWFSDLEAHTAGLINRELRLGLAQSETLDQMVRRIRGRSVGRGRFRGGVLGTTTRHAETIARTGVNHIANAGHLETYQQNADVLKGLEYTATLDTRTSDICISLDGKVWPLDSEEIRRPPQHPNCRSILVPVVDWEGLGVAPPPEGERASMGGPVPSSVTYQDWLKRQPKVVQDEVLGPAKARLFREGKLDLRGLVTREGRSLTVKELESKAA